MHVFVCCWFVDLRGLLAPPVLSYAAHAAGLRVDGRRVFIDRTPHLARASPLPHAFRVAADGRARWPMRETMSAEAFAAEADMYRRLVKAQTLTCWHKSEVRNPVFFFEQRVRCGHCGKERFRTTNPLACCRGGKLLLQARLPEALVNLMTGTSADAAPISSQARAQGVSKCSRALNNKFRFAQMRLPKVHSERQAPTADSYQHLRITGVPYAQIENMHVASSTRSFLDDPCERFGTWAKAAGPRRDDADGEGEDDDARYRTANGVKWATQPHTLDVRLFEQVMLRESPIVDSLVNHATDAHDAYLVLRYEGTTTSVRAFTTLAAAAVVEPREVAFSCPASPPHARHFFSANFSRTDPSTQLRPCFGPSVGCATPARGTRPLAFVFALISTCQNKLKGKGSTRWAVAEAHRRLLAPTTRLAHRHHGPFPGLAERPHEHARGDDGGDGPVARAGALPYAQEDRVARGLVVCRRQLVPREKRRRSQCQGLCGFVRDALAKEADDKEVLTVQLATCQTYIAELESKLANTAPAPNPVKLEVKVKAPTEAEVEAVKTAADEKIAALTEEHEAKLGRFKRKLDVAIADREKMSKQLAFSRLGNKKVRRDLCASYKAEDRLVDDLHPLIALIQQNRDEEQKALATLSKALNARLVTGRTQGTAVDLHVHTYVHSLLRVLTTGLPYSTASGPHQTRHSANTGSQGPLFPDLRR
jgi:hypothetical protein